MVPQGPPAYNTPLKLDKALSIFGWCSVIEVVWLADEATKHSRIVELGSYLGRSTRALADNTLGSVIVVDDFKGPRDAISETPEEIYRKFHENMQGVFLDKIFVHNCDHATIQPNFTFDMCFIDGSHEYEDVKRDIAKWLPFLEKGGLMCGHDFADEYEGVKRAVCEAFAGKQMNLTDTIWAVTV